MPTRKLGQSTPVFEMHDLPYTADDDPFNIKPLLLQPRRRRSSMLNKWIQDQQQVPTDVVDVEEGPSLPRSGTASNPYLAYPELGTPAFHESVASINSYDLVEDDDIPPEDEISTTPITTPSRRGSRLLQTPSSFRSFHNPFRSSSPAGSLATSTGTAPRSPSLSLFFPRAPRSSMGSAQHTRSSSLSALNILGESHSPQPSSATKSRWRPSVLGHFGMSPSQTSVAPSDTLHTRSRPSISSNHTYTTTTLTTTDGDMPITPPRSSASESVRARSRSMLKLADNASSYSVWSGPSYLDELGEFSRSPLGSTRGATSTMSCDGYIGMPPRPPRMPLGPKHGSRLAMSNTDPETTVRPTKQDNKPEVAYSSENKNRSIPRVSFASLGTRKRKKRLVISGIAAGDTRKFEAAKRWCESFGEVSQITRMGNDDLHVHFRNADVADTVCRLRAKVYIRGVGSVNLSWYIASGTENSR
ncbi:hypothetical protein C8R46DRAFT_223332 [Mycena filopes]|nr:hypothetical protein C8R46DRAFT_223332 [Mycena filopes]